MQNAVPNNEGGMIAVLGKEIIEIEKIIRENYKAFICYVANDNSNGQLVIIGKISSLNIFI